MTISQQREMPNDDILPFIQYKIPLLELHGIVDGKCTCGKICKRAGKHPRTAHGVKDAATYDDVTKLHFSFGSNIGVACGIEFLRETYLYVFDVDPRNGGDETLQNLELAFGRLPPTWSVATGGGGKHFYFRSHRAYGSKKAFPGIEIQGTGSYVVGPGSLHASGKFYIWEQHPDDYDLAPLPQWIVDVLNPTNTVTPQTPQTVPNITGTVTPHLHQTVPKTGTVTPQTPQTVPVIAAGATRISKLEYDEVIRALNDIPNTNPSQDYETWLKIGMALKSTGWDIHAYREWCLWSAKSPKHDDEVMWPKWLSFKRSGITQNTIKKLAAENACYDPICIKNEPPGGPVAIVQTDVGVEKPHPTPDLLSLSSGIVRELSEHILNNAYREYNDWALATALIICSTFMQQYVLSPDGKPVSLFMIIPGFPSQGKDDYIGEAKRIVRLVDERYYMVPANTAAGLVGELYAFCSKVEFIDEFQDNLAKIVSGDNQYSKEKLTRYKDLYNGSDIDIGATKLQSSCTVFNPKLSLIAFGTPEQIANVLTSETIGGGLISRFLQLPKRKPIPGKQKIKLGLPQNIITFFKNIIKQNIMSTENNDAWRERETEFRKPAGKSLAKHFSPFKEPKIATITPEANDIFNEFNSVCENYYLKNYNLDDGASMDRAPGIARRIATLHAAGRGSFALNAQDAVLGIEFTKLCVREISDAAAFVVLDPKYKILIGNANKIKNYMQKREITEINIRQLYKNTHITRAEATAAIGYLCDIGDATLSQNSLHLTPL